LDDNGVIVARNKEIKLRPLDKAALQDDRTYWQSINLIIPVIILAILGVIRNFWRQRKYTR